MNFLSKVAGFLSKPSLTPFQFLLLAILFLATLGSLSFAWTAPSAAPTGNNVAAPINTGTANQIKNGGLGVNSLAVYGSAAVTGNASVTGYLYTDNSWIRSGTTLYAMGGSSITTYSGAGQIALKRTDNNPYISFHQDDGTRIAFLQALAGNRVRLTDQNGSEMLTLKDGKMGVGHSDPPNKLHVNGNVGATGWVGAGCEGSCSSDDYSLMYANGRIISSDYVRAPRLCIGTDCKSSWPDSGISAVTTATCYDSGSDATCTVSCPSGYYRTGCSGGGVSHYNNATTILITPSGSSGCYGQAPSNDSDSWVRVYAYCSR